MKIFQYLRFLFLLSAIVLAGNVLAQVQVYKKTGLQEEWILHVYQQRVLPAGVYFVGDAVYSVNGNAICKGNSLSPFDVVYTVRDNKLYKGDSSFQSDILYTFSNGGIYKGNSTFSMDQVYVVQNDSVYLGTNVFEPDRLLFLDGSYTLPELFAVMLALELL